MMSTANTTPSFVNNPSQTPSTASFNPSVPPGSAQPRTVSFGAGSTTTPAAPNTTAPQAIPPAYPPQNNANAVPTVTTTQPPQQQQQPPQQQQQRPPAQLSAAQQRLQAIRQQQQQQQQTQAPPSAASNQYSLRSRRELLKRNQFSRISDLLATQSRYVDVLASNRSGVAPAPNVALNDLMPTPSSGMPTYAAPNQANNYFVPGN